MDDSATALDFGDFDAVARVNNGVGYLTPMTLCGSPQPPVRVALIGSCLLDGLALAENAPAGHSFDRMLVNNMSPLPERSEEEIRNFDFIVIQVPLRIILGDHRFWHISCTDIAAYEALFENARDRIEHYLDRWMQWNEQYGLLTFVMNFMIPQANSMGRLFPRYDLRNIQHFIEKLNESLERTVRRRRNAYVFDLDGISASVGRRFTQEDVIMHFAHGSFLELGATVTDRIEPLPSISKHYELNWHSAVRPAVWAELLAMHRTVRQIDPVKLVVVDLDDTLWRGVSGDMEEVDPAAMTEGWPLGLMETLALLKQRGIMIAIISKNEDQRIREIWPRIFGNRITLDAFAAVMINWRPKPENMAHMLGTMNLLPRNVVFIDDNPVERAAMKAAFPAMRILGRYPYYVRRILLWSAETQSAAMTEESARRTEMMQRQFEREGQRAVLSREEFLRAAAPCVTLFDVTSTEHPRFARILELINKTNQFNTTGRRWKLEELQEFLGVGGRIFAFEVTDSFTPYGLVGVVLVQRNTIAQWVMSCRVLGYDIEQAVMSRIIRLLATEGDVHGSLTETEANFPCRSLFQDCGFVKDGNEWRLDKGNQLAEPAHVTVEFVES